MSQQDCVFLLCLFLPQTEDSNYQLLCEEFMHHNLVEKKGEKAEKNVLFHVPPRPFYITSPLQKEGTETSISEIVFPATPAIHRVTSCSQTEDPQGPCCTHQLRNWISSFFFSLFLVIGIVVPLSFFFCSQRFASVLRRHYVIHLVMLSHKLKM